MKERESVLSKSFGESVYGVNWAIDQISGIKVSDKELLIGKQELLLKVDAKVFGDGYNVTLQANNIMLSAATATGMIGGLLDIAAQVEKGSVKAKEQTIKFKTRFYKHEVKFRPVNSKKNVHGRAANAELAITNYSDEFMEALFQEIASRHFNSFVVYSGYHPFESFLDYKGFECAADKKSAKTRAANHAALSRLLVWAKRYGLKTYLHHYVSHFTQELSDHLKLGLDESGGRLARFSHPEVDRYNSYIYKRTSATIPALDGYFFNFESTGNTTDFIINVVVKTLNKMKEKPPVYLRLWGISDLEGIRKIVNSYKGEMGFIHKGHDTNDVYYYPVADDRVKVWKKEFPKNEFTFSLGPCHNCGTNICGKLWTDEDYILSYLKSAETKGADSISFQSMYDLLSYKLPDNKFLPDTMLSHSQMNIGHIETYVAYIRSERVDLKAVYAESFNTTIKNGALLRKTIQITSRQILELHAQFLHGSSQDGYLFPGRFSHYQEPFFYYPMSFSNRIGEVGPNMRWRSWLVRDKKIKVVPNDTQAVIDYVNPAVKRVVKRNPAVIIKEVKSQLKQTEKNLAACEKAIGNELNPIFVQRLKENMLAGEWLWREIQISIELYSCYFAKTQRAFFNHLRKAHALMIDCVEMFDGKYELLERYCSTTFCGYFKPDWDAEQIAAILEMESKEVSWAAMQEYMKSHERYNEIRRLNRAYISVVGKNVVRNRRLLKQSLKHAEKSMELLAEAEQPLYRDNVSAWAEYVRAELDWLIPPAMACVNDADIANNEDFRAMVHDQNYRWGEHCWEDFMSFYKRQNFFRDEICDCRATVTKTGLKVTLREHDIDWKQRKEVWDKNRGTMNQTGFMQVFLDPGRLGKDLINYTVYFEGEAGTVSGRQHGAKPKIMTGCDTNFEHTDSSWRCDLTIPWKQLGGKPKPGDEWGMNIFTNPAVLRNQRVIWSQGYEFGNDAARLGSLVF